MEITSSTPKVPIADFKRTKIIVTVGPSSNSYNAILAMLKAGANGFRLNFSHGDHQQRLQHVQWIRKASLEFKKPVAIIQDLQGPKIRVGDFEGIINIQTGESLRFGHNADYQKTGIIPTQFDLAKKVKRGDRLFLFDGRIQTVITAVKDGIVYARAENNGVLVKRKGINLPDTDFAGDIITKKDREDIASGIDMDLDFVAVSFIQHESDIVKVRNILKTLGSKAKVIAKIETKAATEDIEDIVRESDMVMVARGDLAIETLPESVPIIQRKIIGLGLKYGTPTIVATQMLASMTEAPEPTRAEVSDVATAVILGADCVMLSDETASGKYPIESVQIMKRVILYVQKENPVQVVFDQKNQEAPRSLAISNAVIKLAKDLDAVAIVAETQSGNTAIQISSGRPKIPLIVVASSIRTAQQLAIVYGTKTYNRPAEKFAATKLTNWLQSNKVLKKNDIIVTVSGKYPGMVGTTDTIKVRVL